MVEAPEWMLLTHIGNDMDRIRLGVEITKIPSDLYSYLRKLDEKSKDFKVTWKLKEKIDRRLHKNRPLALSIGRWLTNHSPIGNLVAVSNGIFICTGGPEHFWGYTSATLPDDYIIPDQALQWMKEYQEQGIK